MIYENLITRDALVVTTIGNLAYGDFLLVIFALILIIFLCTTYDSASYVLASASMKKSSMKRLKIIKIIICIYYGYTTNIINVFKWSRLI